MKKQKIHALVTLIVLALLIFTALICIHHSRQTKLLHKGISLPKRETRISIAHILQNPIPWVDIPIKKHDTLTKIFTQVGLDKNTLEKILTLPLVKKELINLRPGQQIYFQLDKNKQLLQMKYPISNQDTLFVQKQTNQYIAFTRQKILKKTLLFKAATIQHSLAGAAHQAGLTYQMFNQLKNIFSGYINYARDIRPGDRFSILYEEYYLEGKKDHPGNIVAAQFTNQGKTYYALRYTYPKNHTGYYTLTGHGVEPLFLRAPLKYSHISSFFTLHRLDPVLHCIRPHLGIDYAAPYGTPIRSIGDGKIIFRGHDHGYGETIIIKYSHKYKALYGHMSRFSKQLHVHDYVHKGQIIGYVGSTGWSTGPHLHFEMYVYGIPRDPLKMKFIGGKSIPKSYQKEYLAYAKSIFAQMKIHEDFFAQKQSQSDKHKS